ncbi:MAG: DUF4339 domain-containing protein [Candidatus Nanopelagicales bacterium]|jgi:hypothetical protein|nr:DUF4339 domain-containing protein [Actinomycetota bacterium]HNL51196.1 DUF4339 domain-containing protein [Actinomycetota bacterium]HNO15270.1 DUF4339 domain-containing protein [Actinomycetota bacterium]HUM86597.1 DUF4339 domain-containing protein [Actinomycetota bacterium]
MIEMSQPVHWVDAAGQQQGPQPLEAVVQQVRAGQLPQTANVWWEGAPGWTPLNQLGLDLGLPAAPASASAALMSGMTDQELDDVFIDLVGRSWDMYKETEYATSIDEAMLGGVITALVDCGFVLIDLETANAWAGTAGSHRLRFEEPADHSRVNVSVQHLTPDPAVAKMIGHRAAVVVGYGQRVPQFSKVGNALKQEVQSGFIVSPEPGTVTFDADLSSGYVYAQIDLLMEIERYVDEHLDVDHEMLRKHLASVVYTMKTFIQARFGEVS